MPTIPLRDGEKINVLCVGKGEPVVLLHGFGSCAAHWLPNVLPHTGRFRFYLPDLRGFGGSHLAHLPPGSAFATYAQDLDDLLDHFGLDQVVLGGISTGAYVCLTYNQRLGFGRVRKYLNIEHGPDSLNSPGRHDGIFGAHQDRLFAGFRELAALGAEHGHGTPYWSLPPAVRIRFRNTVMALFRRALNRPFSRQVVTLAARLAERLLTRYLMPVERWQVYLQVMESFMQGGDTRASLPAIHVPTTVMIGRHSRFFRPEVQLAMARQIPGARAVVFERSGHIPVVDQPLQFQREFSRFLLT